MANPIKFENVDSLLSGTPDAPAIVYAYMDSCYYSREKAPEFSNLAKNDTSARFYVLDVKKYPISVDAVPVIIGVNRKMEIQIQNPDAALETQVEKAKQFALENK